MLKPDLNRELTTTNTWEPILLKRTGLKKRGTNYLSRKWINLNFLLNEKRKLCHSYVRN